MKQYVDALDACHVSLNSKAMLPVHAVAATVTLVAKADHVGIHADVAYIEMLTLPAFHTGAEN